MGAALIRMIRKTLKISLIISIAAAAVICWRVYFARPSFAEIARESLEEASKWRLRVIYGENHSQKADFCVNLAPSDFFTFNRLEMIRQNGYAPLWVGDKYMLKELSTGEVFDPFQWRRDWKLRFLQAYGKHVGFLKRTVEPDFGVNEPGDQCWVSTEGGLLWEMYYYGKLNDLHVKNYAETTFDQLLMQALVVSYNCSPFSFSYLGDIPLEENLRRRGFILKKGGRSYIPVNMETGETIELPPREIFVKPALKVINNWERESARSGGARGEGLFQDRWDFITPDGEQKRAVGAKAALEFYDIQIRWNKEKAEFELVDDPNDP